MKTTPKLLSILLLIMLIQSCKPDDSGFPPATITYHYITAAKLNQTPYFTNPSFDTISFASDKGDTLTFVKTKTDTNWYIEVDNSNPNNPNKDEDHFQTIHNSYSTFKGMGSFDVLHIKNNKYLSPYLKINFKNYTFFYDDIAINDNRRPDYVAMIEQNGKKFYNSMIVFNNVNDTSSAFGYSNQQFGLYFINDKINTSQYLIIK